MENNFRNIINYKYISPLTQQIQLWEVFFFFIFCLLFFLSLQEVFLHLIPSWQQLFRGRRLTHILCLGKLGKVRIYIHICQYYILERYRENNRSNRNGVAGREQDFWNHVKALSMQNKFKKCSSANSQRKIFS